MKLGSNYGTPKSGHAEALLGGPGPQHLALSARGNEACWGNSLWTARPPESREFLACSLVLKAELFQSQETRASRGEACPEDTAPIAKLVSSFLCLLSAGRTWNSGLSFLLFGPDPLPGDPEIGPYSQSGAPWGRHTSTSIHVATQEA